jgi:hypothetical protein
MKVRSSFHYSHFTFLYFLYPWRCLCFGSRLQMTYTTPLRLTTTQWAHRFLIDVRTFTITPFQSIEAAGDTLLEPVYDAAPAQVVR